MQPGGAEATSPPPAVPGGHRHWALRARDRRAVVSFHEAALANGGRGDGPPGLRPAYLAAFVLDPDGNRIEAVCHRA